MRGLHPGPLVLGAKATCSPSPCRARRWDSGVPSKALVGEGEGRGPRGEQQPLLQAPAFHFPRPERSASRRGGRGHAGRAVADCVGEAFAGPPGRSGRSPLRPGTEKACGRPSRPCPHAACRPWRGSKSPFPHEDNRSGLRARPIPGFSSVTPVETSLQTAWGLGVLGGGSVGAFPSSMRVRERPGRDGALGGTGLKDRGVSHADQGSSVRAGSTEPPKL